MRSGGMSELEYIQSLIAPISIMFKRTPAPAELLASARDRGWLNPSLETLYGLVDGVSFGTGELWNLEDVLDSAWVERCNTAFPGGVVIGGNGSDIVFVVDAADSLGRGPGAVFGVDKVYFEAATAKFCGKNLGTLLSALQADEKPWRD